MKDENDPKPPPDDGKLKRMGPIPSCPEFAWYRDELGLPDVSPKGEPGTVESRVRSTVRYLVEDLARRVARELKQPQEGRWPQMRQGMLLDIQQHLQELTIPVIPPSLRPVPMAESGWSAEILGYGDLRSVELQLGNISGDMRLLAISLDQLEREDADELALWLRTTANDLDPWGHP